MNKLIAFALAALLVATVIPTAEARTHGGRYVPGAMGLTVIWCSAEQHSLVPIGNPEEYASPTGWLFSGEPECAPNDATNAASGALGEDAQEGGIGGFAWIIFPSEKGALAVADTVDDVFGPSASFFSLTGYSEDGTNDAVSEGCGPQSIILPLDLETHWQSTPANPLHLMWAWIPEAGATEDLTVCFASAGTVVATIG